MADETTTTTETTTTPAPRSRIERTEVNGRRTYSRTDRGVQATATTDGAAGDTVRLDMEALRREREQRNAEAKAQRLANPAPAVEPVAAPVADTAPETVTESPESPVVPLGANARRQRP